MRFSTQRLTGKNSIRLVAHECFDDGGVGFFKIKLDDTVIRPGRKNV
jgi:hypothetical protein